MHHDLVLACSFGRIMLTSGEVSIIDYSSSLLVFTTPHHTTPCRELIFCRLTLSLGTCPQGHVG
eukprot:Nitzschia sp. Nitz4//scaffold65_size103378//101403//102727//NITZ4_004484-RA/size103378-exonerate_est2genome-gene-0.102-mRNA-1//1//CDS//3329556294//8615//frame0